jgi:hypothetical protein
MKLLKKKNYLLLKTIKIIGYILPEVGIFLTVADFATKNDKDN